MGGENSAFKALVPNPLLAPDGMRRLSDYTDSEEEINVNDESDVEVQVVESRRSCRLTRQGDAHMSAFAAHHARSRLIY